MIGWHNNVLMETDSGSLRVTAYARDGVGNAPWMCLQTDPDSGFVSMTLEQAEAFARKIAEMVQGMRE